MSSAVRRVGRLAARPVLWLRRAYRVRVGRERIEARIASAREALSVVRPSAKRLSVVITYRVTDPDRLRLLAAVVNRLSTQIQGSGIPVVVVDASPESMVETTGKLWAAAGVDVRYEASQQPMGVALDRVLRDLETPYFYLQFDDMVTAGLSSELLASACELLDVVGDDGLPVAFLRPVNVRIDDAAQVVELATHKLDPVTGRLHFFAGPGRPPVRRFRSGGFEYALIRNPTYGFFVNHLVASTADYRRRLSWYMHQTRSTSVHDVELAAAPQLIGPYWTHLAVPLGAGAVLDLDFAHTDAAVRPDVPENRRLLEVVERGYELRCVAP